MTNYYPNRFPPSQFNNGINASSSTVWAGDGTWKPAGDDSLDPYNLAQYDGVTDCTAALQAAIDACFGPSSSPHSATNAKLNKPLIIPPGQYNITSPLLLTKVRGGVISGAGRFTTTITNTAGGNVFQTNGCEYSVFEQMQLVGSGSAELFKLDWDNSSGVALQSNTFRDMFFQGGGYGVSIGSTGFMGSENLFLNCFWANQSVVGLAVWNYNALQNTVVGGNFQSCALGIWVYEGSIPNIVGTGFQNPTGIDIKIENAAGDCYSLTGCRSESPNFLYNPVGTPVTLQGCTQISSSDGYFVNSNGPVIIQTCRSSNGKIIGNSHSVWRIDDPSTFGRPDWQLTISGPVFLQGSRYPAPVNTALPVITGTPKVGETLICSTGTWTGNTGDNDKGISQRTWFVDGAIWSYENSYVPDPDNAGKMISCMVVATNANGGSSFVTSDAVGPIEVGPGTFRSIFTPATPNGDSGSWEGYTSRQVIPASLTTGGGVQIRFTLKASSTVGFTLTDCFVGVKSGAYGMVSPVRVQFGGSNGVTVGVGASTVSDSAALTFADTDDLVFAMAFASTPASGTRLRNGVTGVQDYFKAGNDAANTSPSGYTDDDPGVLYAISLIEAAE